MFFLRTRKRRTRLNGFVTCPVPAIFLSVLAACGGSTVAPPLRDTPPDGGSTTGPDASEPVDASVDGDADSDDVYQPPPPSCAAGAPGAGPNCGASNDDDCCASEQIPAGDFIRFYDGVNFSSETYRATLDAFRMDRYEVTVGRFRQFVDAYPTSLPMAGGGAHASIASSGWNPSWPMPSNAAALRADLESPDPSMCEGQQTWTDQAASNENLPMNCASWYELFAFCAWDGGYLPTDAEWNYVASGGSDQRVFPWSSPPTSTTVGDSYAVYTADGATSALVPLAVGMKPAGTARWGQLDMGGNIAEMVLDAASGPDDMNPPPAQCDNCANFVTGLRTQRGGAYAGDYSYMWSANARQFGVNDRSYALGARCARAL
jgi:sulfatase modifying factor 1